MMRIIPIIATLACVSMATIGHAQDAVSSTPEPSDGANAIAEDAPDDGDTSSSRIDKAPEEEQDGVLAESDTSTSPASDAVSDPPSEPQREDARVADKEQPTVTVSQKGLFVASSDGQYAIGLKAFAQVWYDQVESGAGDARQSGFTLGMLRPHLYGKLADRVAYNFMLNITPAGVNILNAFVSFKAHERIQLHVGLQKPIFNLEWRQLQTPLVFFDRSMVSSLSAIRDTGVAIDTTPVDRLRLELGVYNGADDGTIGTTVKGDAISMNAGLQWNPIGGTGATPEAPAYLTAGGAVRLRRVHADPTAPRLVSKQSLGGHTYAAYAPGVYADGRTFASTLFAYGGYEGLYAQAEFATSNEQIADGTIGGELIQTAWHVSAGYAFGGRNGWLGVTPNRSVFEGGLGALEIRARAHGLQAKTNGGDFLFLGGSPTDQGGAVGASAGLTWHLSYPVRVQLDYSWTTFDEAGARISTLDEHVVRLGISAGL